MIECGLSKYIGKKNSLITHIFGLHTFLIVHFFIYLLGLPENSNFSELERLYKEKLLNVEYNPITILSALLNDIEDAYKLHNRLKFSAYERDLLYFIMKFRDATRNSDLL